MFGAGKQALILLAAHQRECSERYASIKRDLELLTIKLEKNTEDGRDGRRAIYRMLWGIAAAVIVCLFSFASWALVNMLTWRMPVH